ncbi:MAG TPA: RecQ family ATP-dependent DNA helicase [Bacillota bacterium]|nr:RecQ family ATP-dependent DNA helicase [Bacillota bacterium]
MVNIDLEKQLRKYFKLTTFRPGQKEIIQDVLDGKDVLGVLPTGSGKSLCYQLPARVMDGLTIVVSPLISLMMDQVKQLKARQFKDVVAINSFMTYEEKQSVFCQLHLYKLIYVSPEQLQQREFISLLQKQNISLFVIDEAHCISQWGHEFRPDYSRLDAIIDRLNDPPVLALSATATEDVQEDIAISLNRPHMVKHVYPTDRNNITFCIKQVNDDQEKMHILKNILSKYKVPVIIYFSSRQATEKVTRILASSLPDKSIASYHGGMDQMERTVIQQQFMNDQIDVICSTSAFGMGIDKPNIRLVIHYHFPLQLEDYIQEVGRAGRDGKSSVSLLLYAKKDEAIPLSLIHKQLPTTDELLTVFNKLYQLYQRQSSIPKKEEDAAALFDLEEIQWRFLHFQLECHGILRDTSIVYHARNWEKAYDSLCNLIEQRLNIKKSKLHDIIRWINDTECLRKQLYRKFQNTYSKPIFSCCSNCGFNFAEWQPDSANKTYKQETWQRRLKHIFHPGDHNEKAE